MAFKFPQLSQYNKFFDLPPPVLIGFMVVNQEDFIIARLGVTVFMGSF
jgi:hypothetical protein